MYEKLTLLIKELIDYEIISISIINTNVHLECLLKFMYNSNEYLIKVNEKEVKLLNVDYCEERTILDICKYISI